MAGITYTDYPLILDTSSMEWVAVGYLTHIGLAIGQGVLAGCLLVSGLFNLFFQSSEEHPPGNLIKLSLRFGLIANTKKNNSLFLALTQLVLGAALLAPSLFSVSHWLTVVALFLILILLAYHNVKVTTEDNIGSLARRLLLLIAFVASTFSVYEGKDNMAFGIDVSFTAKNFRDKEIAWQLASDVHSPKLHELAPDFSLINSVTGQEEQLSNYLGLGKPVVLFFGANSCPAFSEGSVGINRLFAKYQDKVHFIGVYVKEPHPTDEWWLGPSRFMTNLHQWSESRAAIDIPQPETQMQRNFFAKRAQQNLLHKDIPLLVDTIDNQVNNRWTGQPTRIYLLDSSGRIIYNPGTGPYSFNPDYLEPELEKALTTSQSFANR